MAMIPLKLPKELAEMFQDIGEHLKYKSRFKLPSNLESIVETIANNYSENSKTIEKGTAFWRARINGVDQIKSYDKNNMGSPPKGVASSGRINPLGISYLYGAFSEKTAVSEVRPWKGSIVSVGEFKTTKELIVTDLSVHGAHLKGGMSKDPINDFSKMLISGIVVAKYFSAPAHDHDQLAYLPSQYISERIKDKGIQAIMYPSVLDASGKNIAFFSPNDSICESVKTVTVSNVNYEFKNNA